MPTPTSYVYTISTDIPSGLVSVARLRQEIELSAIVTMIDFVAGGIVAPGNNTVTIWFKDPLPTPDKVILDGSASAPAAHPTIAGSLLYTHSGLALPDDPQNVNVTGGSVTVDGAVDANGKILSPDNVTFLGDVTNPLRVSPVGNTAITAASLPLPAGASTEATLVALNTNAADIETILTSIKDTAGIKKITDQLPAGTNNIGDVDVVSSALPTGAATEATLVALNTNAADIEAILTAIRDTAGIKKITDALPAGANNIGAVDVVSSALPTGAATEATLIALNTNAADIETVLIAVRDTAGIKKITDALPAGTNNIGDVDVVSSALPTGAATEGTLATRATEATAALIKAKTDNLDVLLSTRATESTVASINTATGTTADPDTANTIIGRLKQLVTKLAGGLPAALTGAGNLKTSILEAFPAGTNRLGAVRLVDANDVALDLARNTTIPAGSRGLLVVGDDEDGKAQAIEVNIDALDGKRRLQIEGKVAITNPNAPANATSVVAFTFSGALSISSTQTDDYTITDGKRFVLQTVSAGSEGDTSEKGSVIEVFYFDGTTETLIDREYINGFTVDIFPNTEKTRNNATFLDGSGTSRKIRVKRRRLSGSAQEVDFVIRGYEYTP